MRFNVVFSGFANDTPWFLFAALLLGRIASKSGLARRLAYSIMLRVGSTYSRILLGLIMTDFILTFIVPSGLARVAILATISLALIEAFQAQKGSNIARGMFLIMTYTGNLFDKMILAGAGSTRRPARWPNSAMSTCCGASGCSPSCPAASSRC